ncbi:MAG: glycosyltransferase [Alphaproteobacteria bacterium]|nr:glycosyltransferase [Alphaproteobacteria bacterium]
MSAAYFFALLALLIWSYLLLGRGLFWLPRLFKPSPAPKSWPRVTAVVPARDEAATVGAAVTSLLKQDYAGAFSVVLVDDHSGDDTARIARDAAAALGMADRLRIVAAPPLPGGWTGKLWALSTGVRAAVEAGAPDLYLFTDADIAHHPRNLAELAARIGTGYDLVSLMVRLHCRSAAERFLIPAFVYFFAMLYPFAWSNDPRKHMAAAAGGCMLMQRTAFERIGGFEAVKGEMIDDCALARAVKRGGRIWLGLTRETRSLRAYPSLAGIWNVIARTAYAQLGYSVLMLLATVAALGVTFLAPVLVLPAGGLAAMLGFAAWAVMSVTYVPMLRFYGLSAYRALLLPAIAAVYLAATVASAWRHWRGRGGEWKGRVSWQNRP